MSDDRLIDKAREALLLDDLARIRRVRGPRWIGYPRAKQILTKLEELLSHPPSHRMPNLLIVGDTNNGKTMLVNRFQGLHPPRDRAGEETARHTVLAIQAPPVPDEGRLYNTIFERLGAPYKENDPVGKKQF